MSLRQVVLRRVTQRVHMNVSFYECLSNKEVEIKATGGIDQRPRARGGAF